MPGGFFVTGTDTGVGKTWVSVAIAHKLRERYRGVAVMKPVATGCRATPRGLRSADAEALAAAASVEFPYALINPYAFEAAIAPHIAASELDRVIDLEKLSVAFERLRRGSDVVVVEGVGGWQVPLNRNETTADLARRLALPVILVVGVRLGCINHALLTAAAIYDTGLPFAGWIANQVDPSGERFEANVEAIETRLPAALLGIVPHLPRHDADKMGNYFRVPGLDTAA